MAKSKYGNAKTATRHGTFDSRGEASRFFDLDLLAKSGAITELERQVEFVLQDGFRDSSGAWVRPIIYVADFSYKERGKPVVEDFKGVRTEVFKIKKKLFQFRYPEIVFRETRAK